MSREERTFEAMQPKNLGSSTFTKMSFEKPYDHQCGAHVQETFAVHELRTQNKIKGHALSSRGTAKQGRRDSVATGGPKSHEEPTFAVFRPCVQKFRRPASAPRRATSRLEPEELVASLAKSTTAVSLSTVFQDFNAGVDHEALAETHGEKTVDSLESYMQEEVKSHVAALLSHCKLTTEMHVTHVRLSPQAENGRSPTFTCLSSLLKPLLSEIDSWRRSEPTLPS